MVNSSPLNNVQTFKYKERAKYKEMEYVYKIMRLFTRYKLNWLSF